MEATVYNQQGKVVRSLALPANWALPWNADLVHQVIVSMQANERRGTANTKGRGEVRGGGRKPWRQKGTGRARHGSIRSPLWVGGGVTHGPTSAKDYTKKINRQMKARALLTILSQKLRDGEIIFLDKLHFDQIKTKTAAELLATLSRLKGFSKLTLKEGRRVLLAVPQKDQVLAKSFRNLKTVAVNEAKNVNPLSAATYQYLIISQPEESLPVLDRRPTR